MSTTVTSKGQVTIPKAVRDLLGIEPGTEVEFRRTEKGDVVLERVDARPRRSRFEKLRGTAGPGMSTDEIMALLRGDD